MVLDAIVPRLRHGRDAEALAMFLELWRAEPQPRYADLIQAVSDRITRTRPRIDTRKPRAFAAEWHAIEARGDVADFGRLACGMAIGPYTSAYQRLVSLAERPPDPRIAAWLLDLVEHPPTPTWTRSTARQAWSVVRTGLIRHADPRSLDRLRQWEQLIGQPSAAALYVWGPLVVAHLRGVVAELETKLPRLAALSSEVTQRCDEALALLQPQLTTGDELLAQLQATPSDPRLRAVYADWLSARDDPRGEFIALQLHRTAAGADQPSPRERSLWSVHEYEWMQGLVHLVHEPLFRDGFLDDGRFTEHLHLGWTPLPPALSTLRRVRIDGPRYPQALEAFAAPQLARVCEVEVSPIKGSSLYEWVEAATKAHSELLVHLRLSRLLRAEIEVRANGPILRLFDAAEVATRSTTKHCLAALKEACSGRQRKTQLLPAIELDRRWTADDKTLGKIRRLVWRISAVLVPMTRDSPTQSTGSGPT